MDLVINRSRSCIDVQQVFGLRQGVSNTVLAPDCDDGGRQMLLPTLKCLTEQHVLQLLKLENLVMILQEKQTQLDSDKKIQQMTYDAKQAEERAVEMQLLSINAQKDQSLARLHSLRCKLRYKQKIENDVIKALEDAIVTAMDELTELWKVLTEATSAWSRSEAENLWQLPLLVAHNYSVIMSAEHENQISLLMSPLVAKCLQDSQKTKTYSAICY